MDFDAQISYRDGLILGLIHLFGISYFVYFVVSFFLYHFSKSPGAILKAQVVTLYSMGVLLWKLSSLTCTMALIYTTAVPSIAAAHRQQSYLRSVYLSGLTSLAIGKISTILAQTSDASMARSSFHWDCLWLGFWALVPSVHALQTQENPPPLTVNLVRIATWNLLAAAGCAAQIPERLGVVGHWHPSLYAMHLVLVWSSISYAQEVWDMVL
ncbi:hypothetical protein CBS115989_10748 [Aspergillus niger]|nr:hypothetical protein CBS115989_10748 [Aspergillus niger]KAI2836575.1 hypothetical protein CBS11232_10154 [Aspergillus niger]KAI2854327.1 hypothetical protein CBS12448_7734 [Aspergillus niger]KAI2869253.1 hypothetical protein CBS115988_10157 [Aspergillus niger]KAI2914110.1 hypothetical protein CBS147320_10409 [Aspergillus niger]